MILVDPDPRNAKLLDPSLDPNPTGAGPSVEELVAL
jgi:hypothetical protein